MMNKVLQSILKAFAPVDFGYIPNFAMTFIYDKDIADTVYDGMREGFLSGHRDFGREIR
jgi:hypothetical protein